MDKEYLKNLIYKVNGAVIEVHKALGPGLLESIYHKCLKKELTYRNISFKSEMLVPVYYREELVETELFCDLFVENCLVVELKAVEKVLPIHEAQLLTYMKLLEVPMGLIINFNCLNIFESGQKTYVNDLYRFLH
ncbi:GxxExxY protein [Pedobacter paludis]|uniref:GxxExxY protein n=1 Tax=Pedobacter paludis TaxID=2203212 RepID=A0A317F252_9SPHI|nr:GxxExxY protein [Pedobacter paludis]PWS32127.1 GxxExxY protein [Pedobacter paludis]